MCLFEVALFEAALFGAAYSDMTRCKRKRQEYDHDTKTIGFIADNVLYYTLDRYSYYVTVQNRYVITCK